MTCAINFARTRLIELLLDYGWDINESYGERTLMHHDANHGYGAAVRTYLAYGADPNIKNRDGRTALHLIAARGAGREVIHALVEAGADINVRDNDGVTPLDLARKAKRPTAARVLIELGVEE